MTGNKPHLQRGAAEVLEFLNHYLTQVEGHLDEAARNIRRNPGLCEDALRDAHRDLARIHKHVETLAAMLERRALRDDLVAATEALKEALTRIEPPDDTGVVPFPSRREA